MTTFPCHECARNIVAAGLSTVTYLQPYDKSMARDLYSDLIDFRSEPLSPRDWQQTDSPQKVIFAPFEGIAPHRFDELFSRMNRKQSLLESAWSLADSEGLAAEWDSRTSVLRDSIRGYQESELDWHFEVARRFGEESVIGDLTCRYTEYKMERGAQLEMELIDANQS